VTSASIIKRNRANAKKSTGPRTAQGKATVSANARRHGATARVDPEQVARWLGVILDQPSLGLDDILSSDDDRIGSALALAEAEMRLARSENLLKAFEIEAQDSEDKYLKIYRGSLPVIAGFNASLPSGGRLTGARKILKQIAIGKVDGKILGGWRHKLLLRYRNEARARRRRAFQNWVACLQRLRQK
jgi:hypothetical protein